MKIQRREMLHLLGATGGWLSSAHLIGCDSTTKDPQPEPEPLVSCDDTAWWLCENFAPVDELETTSLEVEGSLPSSLVGVYTRNGPNPTSGESGHWFLGDGMVHGVRLEGGEAKWYRARYVETEALDTPPDDGLGPPSLTKHQANTALLPFDDKILCLFEVGLPYAITRNDLSTVGVHDFGGQLEGSMTAHPKVDPVTGEIVFFGYDALTASVRYYVASPQGMFTHQATVELPSPVMMHDFQVTESHIVWMDLPVLFDLDLAVAGEALPFSWQPNNGARIGVMPRQGENTDVVWFDVEPCYVFHTFNAYNDPENPNRIILHAIRYPEMWVTSPTEEFPSGALYRFTMDLDTGDVTEEMIDDLTMEFPKIDPRRQGRKQRFGYSLAAPNRPPGQVTFDGMAKRDFDSGKVEQYLSEGRYWIDEPTFIPESDDAGEDEGWLVSFGFNRETNRSELLVVDATDVTAGPVARVLLPQRVPHGFHGTWSPG